ncbi:MAG: site-2 protease family protein [Pyrinomonadaceae bacterium]|nr:site-2 protease family protein [Pyrinomonadaceae bacterium]
MSESIRVIPTFVDAPAATARTYRRVARPTVREWARFAVLFLLTAVTTTIAGVVLVSTTLPEPALRAPSGWLGYLLYIPELYVKLVAGYIHLALTQPALLMQGASFAGSLLAILTAHEFGHYIACRRYGVEATLPFFIPSPPLIGPGTFGAFIKIKSTIPSRHALFDIGVAGPLAGFVIVIPIAIIGLLTAQPAPLIPAGDVIYFNDPLLMRALAKMLGVQLNQISANPFYLAAWIGLLVTSLNLLPVGQLDGGHAVYAVFGLRTHRLLGRAAFAVMTTLAVLGWFWHRSPSGFLYTVLLAIMLRVRHPQPVINEPLGRARLIVALVTLLVFALSFWPFPITFS